MSAPEVSDDSFDGDLGLGNGLRPGALTFDPSKMPTSNETPPSENLDSNSDRKNSGCSSQEDSDDEVMMLMPISSINELKAQYSHLIPKSNRSSEVLPRSKSDEYFYDGRYIQPTSKNPKSKETEQTECQCKSSDCQTCEQRNEESFPVYADVQYGTSIRQQKELFNHNIEKLKKKKCSDVKPDQPVTNKGNTKAGNQKYTSEEIALKLAVTLQEVDELRGELEACEQKLDSKYKAIDILRKQAEEAQQSLKRNEQSTKQTAVKLAQVNLAAGGGSGVRVNSLGPSDLDLGDLTSSHLPVANHSSREKERVEMKPKQVSEQKYKRMCEENRSLGTTLASRTEDLRKVTSRLKAVERENDELLALLDIQERSRYEASRSTSPTDDTYGTFSSAELAVLGACRCRISNPEPCGCAHAAASLHKRISHLKSEVSQYKMRRDEAYHTVDAYRLAFEEQLQKNKALTLQLANLSLGRTSSGQVTGKSRARLALGWLIGSLNDEDVEDTGAGPTMTEYELITYLTEMLNEKKEVLAHQKLASQILADRVKVLEQQLQQYEQPDESGT